MGRPKHRSKPKHGKESARTKKCVKYRLEGRRERNKACRAERYRRWLEKRKKKAA